MSGIIGVEPSVLRFWESQFPTLKPKTTGRNVRQYTEKDIELLKLIYNLVKVRGFKIEAARKQISANRGVVEKKAKVQQLLIGVRDELMAIKKELDQL